MIHAARRGSDEVAKLDHQARIHHTAVNVRNGRVARPNGGSDDRVIVVVDRERGAREVGAEARHRRIPPGERELVVWACVDELTHREIGDRLKITEDNSRQRLKRALGKLERIITSLRGEGQP